MIMEEFIMALLSFSDILVKAGLDPKHAMIKIWFWNIPGIKVFHSVRITTTGAFLSVIRVLMQGSQAAIRFADLSQIRRT